MRAILFAFTARGRDTAKRVRASLPQAAIYVPERLCDRECAAYGGDLVQFTGSVFDADALVFVGAAGIAVRAIAPHVKDKRSDPAVLCVDEQAQFVIPLLSGHIGGANRLARQLAESLGATAVITTATDVNGRFAVDAWATENGLHIADMALVKRISSEILTRDIPFCADVRPAKMPDGLFWSERGALGICVSPRDRHPFGETLLLVPRVLRVGIGCRRNAPREAIGALIDRVLQENNLHLEAVQTVATIDLKRDEAGLNALCQSRQWPIAFYTAEQLSGMPGAFSESEFVRETVGVGNVCERAAMLGGGRLIVPKTAENGVTVAVAEAEWGIEFGGD